MMGEREKEGPDPRGALLNRKSSIGTLYVHTEHGRNRNHGAGGRGKDTTDDTRQTTACHLADSTLRLGLVCHVLDPCRVLDVAAV